MISKKSSNPNNNNNNNNNNNSNKEEQNFESTKSEKKIISIKEEDLKNENSIDEINDSDIDDSHINKQSLSTNKKDENKKDENKKPQVLSFIHKLYSMLEEPELNNLIRWHTNNSNFLIYPSEEFSKTLSKYFKHANIASFIRQLNMYGFHKVNDSSNNLNNQNLNENTNEKENDQLNERDKINEKDKINENKNNSNDKIKIDKENEISKPKVLSTRSSQVWEFKHSSGIFRKGNTEALNTIKRRSFKNPTSDKDVHSLKLTYDLPSNIYVPIDSNKYQNQITNNNIHLQQQHQQQQQFNNIPQEFKSQSSYTQQGPAQQILPHQVLVQGVPPQSINQLQHPLQFQTNQQLPPSIQPHIQSQIQSDIQSQKSQQSQNSQQSHQNQPINQNMTIISPASGQISEDSMIIPNQLLPEQERNNLFIAIRELQQSNNFLQTRLNDLLIKSEEAMKLNDIFKEELSNVNHDFITTLDLFKEQLQYIKSSSNSQIPSKLNSQGVSQFDNSLFNTIDNIRSKVIDRNNYRNLSIKSISCNRPYTDLQSNNMQGQQSSFQTYQPHSHIVQTSTSTSSPQVFIQQNGPTSQRSGSQPTFGSNNTHTSLSTPRQQIQQGRNLSTPSPGAGSTQQHNTTFNSLQPTDHRNPSATSVTSNPYYNSSITQTQNGYNYFPEYNQLPQSSLPPPPQQQQQQILSQPLLNKAFNNPRSASSSITKYANSTSYIQQNGPTSNPQANLQRSSGVIHNDELPFLHKDIRYSLSLSSDRSRNASVYDPLQQLPFSSNIPIQMISATQNNNGQPNQVQFFPINQQQIMNNNYSTIDPNNISRQYSSNQMYTPVFTDNIKRDSIFEDKSHIHTNNNFESPLKRNSDTESNGLNGVKQNSNYNSNINGMSNNNNNNNNNSSSKDVNNCEVNKIKENKSNSDKKSDITNVLNQGKKRDLSKGENFNENSEIKREISDNKIKNEREIKKMKI